MVSKERYQNDTIENHKTTYYNGGKTGGAGGCESMGGWAWARPGPWSRPASSTNKRAGRPAAGNWPRLRLW